LDVKKRFPRGYDGTRTTSRKIGDILPVVLGDIGEVFAHRPDLIIAAWPEVIGPKLAPMTRVVGFREGTLEVVVKNSTLHSLLTTRDKPRILKSLRDKFPKIEIKNVYFRLG
jgi:hypothetical protein